jgi:general secretion pathway protein G
MKHASSHHIRRRATRRGFTLLEIIVVVTIIALLATLIAPRLLGRIGQAKSAVASAEVNELAKQVQLYMVDNGISKLGDDFELSMLTSGTSPYVKAGDLVDPWGHDYVVLVPGEHNPNDFDVLCYGADGQPGGDGENSDIWNE